MRQADEIQMAAPGVAVWQAFDRAERSECFSCAALTPSGLVLFDPVRVSDGALADLLALGRPLAAAWTSELTRRDAGWFAGCLGIPEWGPSSAGLQQAGFEIIPLPGAAPGEAAYHHAGLGLLVVGPAASHDGNAVRPLPKKLRADPRLFARSFARLAEVPFRVCCFARGMPIVRASDARLSEFPGGE